MLTQLRRQARKFIDSFYQKDLPNKETIGGPNDFWTILTDRFTNRIVYSGGVGKDIDFELQLAKRFGCHVFCFDPSPTGISTIQSLPDPPASLSFYPVGLSKEDSETVRFSTPLNPEEGSFTTVQSQQGQTTEVAFPCRKVSALMREFGHTHLDILKLDFEGFEYGVLEDVVENQLSITQICVEFHHFFDNVPYARTASAIQLLKQNGYSLIHKTGSDYLFVQL